MFMLIPKTLFYYSHCYPII